MANRTYPWKRFWCPPTGKWSQDENGFLTDPDLEFSQYSQPDVVSFERISDKPCLILLGEPGIGKTTAMRSEYESISTIISAKGEIAIWHELGSFSSEDSLLRRVFECPEIKSWKTGNYRLHLFLDGLDESRLEIKTIDRILSRELQGLPINNLAIRISCRTAEWSLALEHNLSGLFGPDNVGVLELLPLRQIDVECAAKENEIEAREFIELILQKDIVPLSIKPITLDLLLNIYKTNLEASYTTSDLYRRGCLLLCEESNEYRRTAERWGKLSADQRLTIASRIAAATTLCNKFAIYTDIDRGEKPTEDLSIQDICGNEKIDDCEIIVTEDSIRETLKTGLFTSRGQSRMGWAHQTYSEFLAALWLSQRKFSLIRMKDILLSSGPIEPKLIPQLRGVSAWLGSIHKGWRKYLLDNQPEALLLGDLSTFSRTEKSQLVAKLILQKSEDGSSIYKDYYERHFGKLAYPGLPDQLRSIIINPSKSDVLRVTAIKMARSCRIKELCDTLAEIALDVSQPDYIRQLAALTVARIGNDEFRIKLKPLLLSSIDNDPDDELKGCALRALWPDLISIEELLSVLTPDRRDNFIGAYRIFCEYEFQNSLRVDQLPKGLNWVSKTHFEPTLKNDIFQAIGEAIIIKAIENIRVSEVFNSFGYAALNWFKRRHDLVSHNNQKKMSDIFGNDDELRRKVAEAIVAAMINPDDEFSYLIYYQQRIILSRDIPWMIGRYEQAISSTSQKAWAKLIWQMHYWNEPQYFDDILTACFNDKIGIIKDMFSREINPVKLGSPVAEKMKADHEQMREAEKRTEKPPLLDPTPEQRVAKCLEQFEAGDLSAWIRLTRELTLEPDSTHYTKDGEPHLHELPGWEKATESLKSRILKAAEKYVIEGNPETDKWYGTGRLYYSAIAGYQALLLLKHRANIRFENLPNEKWQKWAAIIVCFPYGHDNDLIAKTYQHAPFEVIDIVQKEILRENSEHGAVFIVNRIDHIKDSRLSHTLVSIARNSQLKVASIESILEYLIKHDEGFSYAEELVRNRQSEQDNARSKAIIAAKLLFLHTKDACWPIMWPIAKEDPEFFIEMLFEAIDRRDEDVSLSRFDEDQLFELFILLVTRYPYDTDPSIEGAFAIIGELKIRRFRDDILNHLKSRGTEKACMVFEKIADKHSQIPWLRQQLNEMHDSFRLRTWIPLKPKELFALESTRTESRNKILFPTPEGAQWAEFALSKASDLSIKIKCRDITKTYLFSDIGFRDGRKHDLPDMNWELLLLIIEKAGEIYWGRLSPDSRLTKNLPKGIERISKRLRFLTGLDQGPFRCITNLKKYVALFQCNQRNNVE